MCSVEWRPWRTDQPTTRFLTHSPYSNCQGRQPHPDLYVRPYPNAVSRTLFLHWYYLLHVFMHLTYVLQQDDI